MPRSYGSGRSRAVKGSRRRTGWEVGPGDSTLTNFASTQSVILGLGAQALLDGLTLVRLRGSFRALLTAVAGANDGFAGAVGIGIVTAEAFAIGLTAMPLPLTDMEWDGWLYYRPFSVQSNTATIADGVNSGGVNLEFPVDSKAMRKLREGDTIFAAAQVVENGTSVMDIHFDSRILLKLP